MSLISACPPQPIGCVISLCTHQLNAAAVNVFTVHGDHALSELFYPWCIVTFDKDTLVKMLVDKSLRAVEAYKVFTLGDHGIAYKPGVNDASRKIYNIGIINIVLKGIKKGLASVIGHTCPGAFSVVAGTKPFKDCIANLGVTSFKNKSVISSVHTTLPYISNSV